LDINQESIVKADDKVFSVSAASIIAKVTRDKIMVKYDKKYPEYNFKKHKGYGTKEHLKNIKKNGICEIHRKSFKF
jgi:ribonuclease HII